MKRNCVIFLILLVLFPIAAIAKEAGIDNSWAFVLSVENDFFFGHTDRYYTNGLRLGWTSPDISGLGTESWVARWGNTFIDRLSFMNDSECRRNVSLIIGQNMYTPEDKKRGDLIRDDRPYAGIVFAVAGLHASGTVRMDSLEVVLGLVGPHSYAGEAQEEVHDLIHSVIPKGWGNQLKDEPIVNIFYERTWKSIRSVIEGGLGYDVLPFLRGALGNAITSGSAGVQVRFGWNLPNDFGINRIRPGLNSKSSFDRRGTRPSLGSTGFGLYGFASVNGMAVARNIFLDGNTFTDSHSVDKKPFVAEFTFGISIAVSCLSISYANVAQTKEFEGQREDHKFGLVTFSYSF